MLCGRARFAEAPDPENARQQEILELVGDVTIAANVPAEAVIAEGVGRDPSPDRIGPILAHRLIVNVHRPVIAHGAEDRAQHGRVDISPGCQGDVSVGNLGDPGFR